MKKILILSSIIDVALACDLSLNISPSTSPTAPKANLNTAAPIMVKDTLAGTTAISAQTTVVSTSATHAQPLPVIPTSTSHTQPSPVESAFETFGRLGANYSDFQSAVTFVPVPM